LNLNLLAPPTPSPAPRGAPGAADDLPGEPLSTVVVRGVDELRKHVPAWQRLAQMALEPNVFYEPLMALPACEMFAVDGAVDFVLIYAPRRKHPQGPPVLCGFVPLERRRVPGLPLHFARLWKYDHCFLCTPLIRADYASETLTAFLDWLAADAASAPLLQLRSVTGEGPWHQLLVDLLFARGSASWTSVRYTRAFLRCDADAESYALAGIDRKRRHELRRLEKRLAEQGRLEHAQLAADGDLDAWLDDFVELESRGWKGRNSSALGSSAAGQTFFRRAAQEAFAQGRLMMMALRLEGRSVAQKCNFLAGDGGFAFKIAFDEEFARFSPGAILEMDNIARVHGRPDVAWMDSCAAPDHPMINRLWHDRRTIEWTWVATGRRPGDLLVALSPLAKWCGQKLSRRRTRKEDSAEK
jgi:CelD/BcsL family acetyltransferase involved in cellulose biosynthesis